MSDEQRPMRSARHGGWTRFGAEIGWVLTAGVALWACSLGKGETPTCDPNAPADSPDACQQVAHCDDGSGNPEPTDECCTLVADRFYQTCTGHAEKIYKSDCGASTGGGCCGSAKNEYDVCMAGPSSSGGGGGGAGGGSAGGGGAGGGGAGGGGAGGGGAGGGGAGGGAAGGGGGAGPGGAGTGGG